MTNTALVAEAARKLDNYIDSGIAGFFTQAIDRLRAAGVEFENRGFTATTLRAHLTAVYGI